VAAAAIVSSPIHLLNMNCRHHLLNIIRLIIIIIIIITRSALDGPHVPPTKLFPRLAVNKTILKRAPNTCRWDFPDVIKFRVAARTISEKAIRFRYADYNWIG